MNRVAIIGGGLTGLSTAYYLGQAQPSWQIDVYEKESRFGGKIKTKRVDGYVVEVGPDSYLARKQAMTDLINELGLGETIVTNATGQAFIYNDNRMFPIPGGAIVGIPTEFVPFAKSTLLSWPGKFRAMQDYFKSPYPTDGDVSIGEFFRYHLGNEMMDKLIEPLLSGIYGGNIYELSLDATFPEFHSMERKYGNMVKGMLAARKQRGASGTKPSGQFRQLTGGLESIIDALVAQMPSNVTLYKNTDVTSIEKVAAGYVLGGTVMTPYNELIITTPPQSYGAWFKEDSKFNELISMDLSSCAIAIMGFDRASFDAPLNGTGFVITRKCKTPLTACTYISVKWPQTTPEDRVVLRVFMGKPGDDTVQRLDEESLKELALEEIQKIMNFTAKPLWTELTRLNKSMPQYKVGHRDMIARLTAYANKAYPGLHMIGTPFDGVGMPDGVRQAKTLVDKQFSNR
ncbi:protoporphyrinogen oxidase [uncultured Veillonella sp.]|uniref:protoporphyrinogen oxidase n=1 Tax=uncultured Veillonella sp. TaxID=159268 RepID=UPI0026343182|nr:protoporphyrinogen oxidase [uncultured Veillonella sp.]